MFKIEIKAEGKNVVTYYNGHKINVQKCNTEAQAQAVANYQNLLAKATR